MCISIADMSAYQGEIYLSMVNISCFYNGIQLQCDYDCSHRLLYLNILFSSRGKTWGT